MKINEYELALKNDKLGLKVKRRFDWEINYIDDTLALLLKAYNIPDSPIEKAFVLSCDINGKITGIMQIGIGDHKTVDFNLNSSFKFLLLNNAYGCIFVHNHPKGAELSPSTEDYSIHGNIMSLCLKLGIDFCANIILQGYDKYFNINKNKFGEINYEWED